MIKDKRGHLQRVFLPSLIGAALLIVMIGNVFAQQPESQQTAEVANILTWATRDPPLWSQGIIYAFLGMVGALITIFSLIGGVVPGTAGQAKIAFDTKRLEK